MSPVDHALATPPEKRRNSIGALRLALATMVLYTHAHLLGGFGLEPLARWSRETTLLGTIAVQGFFVLSGWLITASWCRHPTLGRFLWHRLLRLVPALWLCLVFTAGVLAPLLWLATPHLQTAFASLDPSPFGYVWRNLLLPRSQISIGPLPLGGAYTGDWNGSLWTLFYEGACYALVGVLGFAGLFTMRRATGTTLLAGMLILLPIYSLIPAGSLPPIIGRLYDTPGKLLTMHFLAGALWALWPEHTARALRRFEVPLVAAAALVVSWRLGASAWASPLLLSPLLLWLAQRRWLTGFERRVGGDYSYGLYLYAFPVQQCLAAMHAPRLGFAAYFVSSFLLALALAAASWHLVERRALGLKSLSFRRFAPLSG
jgi:peptidoglycan/LPS O-acetylase OafA/YrhL